MKEGQKRITVISDMACYGKCALMVSIPILSAMNLEVCPLPTALLSSNGAFPNYYKQDLSHEFEAIMKHWQEEQVTFDAIMIGFLNSVEQIHLVKQFLERFKREETKVYLDPIMGDHGKFYSVTDERMAEGFLSLLPYCDLITPNLTECAKLLQIEESIESIKNEDTMDQIAEQLLQHGAKEVVITGVKVENSLRNYVYSSIDKEKKVVEVTQLGVERCGTGDVFSSVLVGTILQGYGTSEAVERAAEFLLKSISYTMELEIPAKNGIAFERYLNEL